MSFALKTQRELEDILSAGAGLELARGLRAPAQLVDLAVCAKRGGSNLTLTGLNLLTQSQLIDIARAGAGHVILRE